MEPTPIDAAVASAIVDLHRHLDDSVSLDETLQQVAERAHRVISAADTAAITVYAGGEYRTAAMAGHPAQALDDAQYESDTGPCLDAHRSGKIVAVPEIERASRWPEFRAAALANGVASSISLPLVIASNRLGALNLYCTAPGPLDPEVATLAATFAEKASVAVANVVSYRRLRDNVDQLSEALDRRDRIGQAKGILMLQHKIDADAAFGLLVSASNRANVKLRDIVEDVIATGQLDLADGPGT